MKIARTIISSIIVLFMLFGSIGTLGVMAANDVPDELPATFTMAPARIGDKGSYTEAVIQITNDGYDVLEEEEELFRFNWGVPKVVDDEFGRKIRANMLYVDDGSPAGYPPSWWALDPETDRIVSHAFGWSRGEDDGRTRTGYYVGPHDPASDFVVRYACGLHSPLMGETFSLADTAQLYPRCAWGGSAWAEDVDFRPVARERLGDIDTVLFTRQAELDDYLEVADGMLPSAYHVWINESIPYPIRVAYSWDDGIYNVYRLSSYESGATPLLTRTDEFSPAIAPPVYATPPTHGIDESGTDHMFPLSQAIQAAAGIDPDIQAHLDDGAVTTFARGWELKGDVEGFEWRVDLWDGDAVVAFTITQGPEPDAVQQALGTSRYTLTSAEPEDEAYPALGLLSEARPTLASLWNDWTHRTDRDDANAYGLQLMCSGDACQFVHRIVWAGHQTRTTTTPFVGGPTDIVEETSRWEDRRWYYPDLHDENGRIQLERALLYSTIEGDTPPLVPLRAGTTTGQSDVPDDAGSLNAFAPIWSWPESPGAYIGASILAFGAAALYYFWPAVKFGTVGLFSRVSDPQVLSEHPVRRRILDAVTAAPGSHTAALRRTTELGSGSFNHHMQKLLQAGLVTRVQNRGYTCYFLKGSTDHNVMAGAPALRSGAARKIMEAVLARPGLAAGEAATAAGVSASTASHHIKRLEEAGFIHVDRAGKRSLLIPNARAQGSLDAIAA